MRILVLLPLALLTAAAPQQEWDQPKRLSPDQVYTCQRDKGVVLPGNLRRDEICVKPLADAGKVCTDGSQCVGECMVEQRWSNTTDRMSGACQRNTRPPNCGAILVDGRPVPVLCAD